MKKQFFATCNEMAKIAKRKKWSIETPEQFRDIFLDTLFNDCWIDHIDPTKPILDQISDSQADQLVSLARIYIKSPSEALNALAGNSAAYRKRRLCFPGTIAYLFKPTRGLEAGTQVRIVEGTDTAVMTTTGFLLEKEKLTLFKLNKD